MPTITTAHSRVAALDDRIMAVYRDVAVRQGIKMALAGLLGFAAALWLRLPSPTWCIFTVVVLMLAQYVGAIAEKAMLRAIGTVVGALLGILLVGDFANNPTVMIAGSFIIAAFGTMMFGGNMYPYAFFLGALTTLVVVGTTMENPGDATNVAINRILEITLGIMISTAVTSIIWPRYARVEFRNAFRDTLREAGKIAVARSDRLLKSEDIEPSLATEELRFSTRMNTLRLLLRYGQRESEYFRAKLPLRQRITGELGALFEAAESLGQRLPQQSRYRDLIAGELSTLHDEMEREFDALVSHGDTIESENVALTGAITECEAKLHSLRDTGLTRNIPLQEAMDFSAHYTALIDITTRLQTIRKCLFEIHEIPGVFAPERPERSEPLRITSYWVKNGIKAGITAALALTYVNWIHPPGGATVPFAAWLMTATTRMYPGGQGDRRAFSYVITIALVGIPYSLLLLVITPLLAHYLWMNLFLAVGLFALGFTIAKQGGISLYGQCGMLFFVGAVGLNPQEPVTFQQIADVYFGVVIALLLSAAIQRLLWPLLPQREICSLFAELFARCRSMLGPITDAELAQHEQRVALIPPETAAWIKVATTPEYPEGERQRLVDLLHSAEHLAYYILSARKIVQLDVPEEVRERLREPLMALHSSCQAALAQIEAVFRRGNAGTSMPSLLAAFQPIEQHLEEIRKRYLSGELHFPPAIPYLGAMNFLENAARTIDHCTEQVRGLNLEKYRGDYAL